MTPSTHEDILNYYRQNLSGRRHGGWRAVGNILGVNPGSAYGIAHSLRPITPEQELRWHIYRNVDNPNVKVVRVLTCPSCGIVHGSGLDCHGKAGTVAILPPNSRIVRRKAPCRIQDMTVRELARRIDNKEEIVL